MQKEHNNLVGKKMTNRNTYSHKCSHITEMTCTFKLHGFWGRLSLLYNAKKNNQNLLLKCYSCKLMKKRDILMMNLYAVSYIHLLSYVYVNAINVWLNSH